MSALSAIAGASKGWLKRRFRQALAPVSLRDDELAPEHWGLERGPDGSLMLHGSTLSSLATKSPVFVVDLPRLRQKARSYTETLGGDNICEAFYSYKTNPVPGVLKELHDVGMGAEVISHYELWLARRLGVPPSKIIFNGPAKSEAGTRLAIELGIELLNINHPEEIAVVSRIAGEAGKKPRVGLRVGLGGWSGQFGAAAAGGAALRAYEEALASPHLNVVGLHVHRGGMMHSQGELQQFLDVLLSFSDELRAKLGLRLEVLDVGGSLASPSVRKLSERELRLNRSLLYPLRPPDVRATLAVDEYLRLLSERVRSHYGAAGEPPPRVFLEPGRSATSDTQLLLTKVLGLKRDDERTYAILDAGINLAESCRSEYHQVLCTGASRADGRRVYTLVGPICTPGDTLRWAIALPELAVGDSLAIMDAGAYFVPFSTSFAFPQPAIIGIDDGRVIELRRAETFADLLGRDAMKQRPGEAAAEAPVL